MRDHSNHNNPLVRRVASNLQRRCGVRPGDRLVVGVSGGADSVALLLLLVDSARALDLDIDVAHLDHALRPDSAADVAWVQELARSLGLACHVERWNSPRAGEAAARQARYAFLERVARECDAAAIAVAHHLDDQIETVLLRLGRGAGPRGALGMAWRRGGRVPIVRPLLDVRRTALREVCAAHAITWREDSTNAARDRARNRIRHDVMPALESALGARWMEHWSATVDDWRNIWDWIDAQAAALLDEAGAADGCELEALRRAPEPVLRAAFRRWLDPAEPLRAHLDAAVRFVHAGTSGRVLVLPNGYRLWRDQTRLALFAPGVESPIDGTLHVEPLDADAARDAIACAPVARTTRARALAAPPLHATALFAADSLQPPLEIRTPRRGDRVQLLGARGRRTVARIFQDRRVPRRARAVWPVVADRAGIVWLPGIGVAERVRIVAGTSAALRASYSRAPAGGAPRGLSEATPSP